LACFARIAGNTTNITLNDTAKNITPIIIDDAISAESFTLYSEKKQMLNTIKHASKKA
jgi:hypothetical protein